MANRMKEEEKNEKIIRGLLKHPANKRCINCNSLGPQYVCTNFWTFICINCSGLHREFTHRVKSISMAKFTSQEVSALQEGGNERAREIYFKEWDPQRHSYPDSSHLDRLRDFIKHVYVERRYAGRKSTDGPPRMKGERADYEENRRLNTDCSGSQSPPYSDQYERRFGDRPGSAGRSDDRNSSFNHDTRSSGYDQGDYNSPSRFEMRDEIHRDDKNGNDIQSPKSYKNRISDDLPKPGASDQQKVVYISSPPMVRPVREILGSDVPPLRVSEIPKLNDGKPPNSPSEAQGSTSSKSLNGGNSVDLNWVNSGSLIDFSVDPEPSAAAAAVESFPQQTGSIPADSGGWASFDVSSQQKAPEAASTAGDLESVFAQLLTTASTSSSLIQNNGGLLPAVQQQQPSLITFSSQSTNSPVGALIGPSNNQVPVQLVGPSFPSAVHGSMTVVDGQSTRPFMHPSHGPTASGNLQNPLEVKASGRKELPADLFSGFYSTLPASYPGWRTGPHHGMVYRMPVPHHGMVYRMQYPVMMPLTYGAAQQHTTYGPEQQPVTTFYDPSVSTNPFDLGNEPVLGSKSMINPPPASLQAAVQSHNNPLRLPNRTNLAPGPSHHMPPQQFPYSSSPSSDPYMMPQFSDVTPRQLSSNFFPSVNQGAAAVGSVGAPYGVSNSSELPARTNSNLGSNNSSLSSVGGNPFG